MIYTPSHIRRRKKLAHALLFENADLRRRLAAVTRELEQAEARLRTLASYDGMVAMACRQFERTAAVIAREAGPAFSRSTAALATERREREADSLYIADRRYALKATPTPPASGLGEGK